MTALLVPGAQARLNSSLLGLGVLLVARASAAEHVSDTVPTAQAHSAPVLSGDPAPSADSPRQQQSADVVLVGPVRTASALTELVQQLLAADGISAHILRTESVREADLLRRPAAGSPSRPRIWITQPGPDAVRLFLSDAQRSRYLVRDVPLRSGLDMLGSEQTAQVVQSSTVALLQTREGMSRKRLRSRWRQQAVQDQRPTQPAPSGNSRLDAEGRAKAGPQVWPRVGAAYLAAWTGPELQAMHGPGLRVGVTCRAAGALWSAVAAGERAFGQSHAMPELELRVQTTAARLLLGGRAPLGPSLDLMVQSGAGVDVTRITPRPVPDAATRLAAEDTNVAVWARAEVGPEWHTSMLSARLTLVMDLSLSKTRYLVEKDEVPRELCPRVFKRRRGQIHQPRDRHRAVEPLGDPVHRPLGNLPSAVERSDRTLAG